MQKINLKNIKRIFYNNRSLLTLNFAVLCFICGVELETAQQLGLHVDGYVILVLTNHYQVLYFILPILLIIIAKYSKNIRLIEKIRYRSTPNLIKYKRLEFVCWLLAYFVLQLLIIFLIGMSKLDFSFQSTPIQFAGYNEILSLVNAYLKFFDNSILAILAIIMYFIFGFSVLVSLLLVIGQKFGYQRMIVTALIVYVLTFIGFKTELKTRLPILFFNNYILLHHALFVNGGLKFIFVILVGLLILGMSYFRKMKQHHLAFNDLVVSRREKYLSFTFLSTIFVLQVLTTATAENINFREIILTIFYGTNPQDYYFIGWLRLFLIYFIPIFIVGISESRLKKYGQETIMIRFQNYDTFQQSWLKSEISYLLKYMVLVVMISYASFLLGSTITDGYHELTMVLGSNFNMELLNRYVIGYVITLSFDFVVFKMISQLSNEVVAMLILVLTSFLAFWLPDLAFLNLNFGIANLAQKSILTVGFYFKLLVIVFFGLRSFKKLAKQ